MTENIKDANERHARSVVRDILEKACAAEGHQIVVLNECACGKRAKAKVKGVVTNHKWRDQLYAALPYRD